MPISPGRLTYIHQYFRGPSQAGSTRSYEFVKRLLRDGTTVQMITAGHDWTPADLGELPGLELEAMSSNYRQHYSFMRRKLEFLRFVLFASRVVLSRKTKPDVVFATSTPLTVAIPALLRRWLRGTPYVLEVRDLWPDLPIAMGAIRNPFAIRAVKWLERTAYRRAAAVVALSPDMKARIVEVSGITDDRVVVIPNSCDFWRTVDIDARASVASSGPVALYAGAVGKVNGLQYLVEIAAELDRMRSPVAVWILGDGSERGKIESTALTEGVLGRNLHMFPPVPKSDVPLWYSQADIVLSIFAPVPGMESNSANKFFDALAAARPVAINYEGWQAVLIREKEIGLVLPANPRTAAVLLDGYLQDSPQVSRAGHNAGELARSEFSRDAHYRQLVETLKLAAMEAI